MKLITVDEANSILYRCGLTIGEWGNILPIDGAISDSENWVSYQAPKNDLLNFSHHVSGWLHDGEWKMFQIDKSTGWMNPVQASLFGGLLFGANHLNEIDVNECRTLFFEFGRDNKANDYNKLLISNLIYLFLLFEMHGYVAASCDTVRRYLGVQDGFVYFYTLDNELDEAESLLKMFEGDTTAPPEWVLRVIADSQV